MDRLQRRDDNKGLSNATTTSASELLTTRMQASAVGVLVFGVGRSAARNCPYTFLGVVAQNKTDAMIQRWARMAGLSWAICGSVLGSLWGN